MVFKKFCILVLWTKIASSLEGLRYFISNPRSNPTDGTGPQIETKRKVICESGERLNEDLSAGHDTMIE